MPARMQEGLGTPFKTRRSASSRVTPTFSGITYRKAGGLIKQFPKKYSYKCIGSEDSDTPLFDTVQLATLYLYDSRLVS